MPVGHPNADRLERRPLVPNELVENSTKEGGWVNNRLFFRKKGGKQGLKTFDSSSQSLVEIFIFFSNFWVKDSFQLGSWSKWWIKIKTSLEKPSDKCQRTRIIQTLFQGHLHTPCNATMPGTPHCQEHNIAYYIEPKWPQGLEKGLPLGFWAPPSPFAK